ncbi:MAG: translation initiation factor IF-2 [Chlorobi bacterium]|nr:translation initiation factor IF-2 [Chlorobiota bacterium]
MAVGKRLSKVAREFNVGTSTIVDFLHKKGYDIETNPNAKITDEMYSLLEQEYTSDSKVRKESEKLGHFSSKAKKESISIQDIRSDIKEDEALVVEKEEPEVVEEKPKADVDVKVVGKIDLDEVAKTKKVQEKKEEKPEPEPVPEPVSEPEAPEKEPEEKKEEPVVQPETVEEKKPVRKEPEHIPTKTEKIGEDMKVVGKIDLEKPKKKKARHEKKKEVVIPEKKNVTEKKQVEKEPVKETETATTPEHIPTQTEKLSGPTVVGKIDLPVESSKSESKEDRKKNRKKRKRIRKEKIDINAKQPAGAGNQAGKNEPRKKKTVQHKLKKRPVHKEVDDEDVQKQIKETLARLTKKGKSKASKYRREKRESISQKQAAELEKQDMEKKILKVTEFVTANDLANMMDVPVNEVISTFMSLGVFVSINQRLDAETLSLVAEEFGYQVEFVDATIVEAVEEEEDNPEDLVERPPIVTIMGHVDHGKTSLLDFIRKTNVIAGEAGGITQHIGAYSVELDNGRKITFLDTPGHEAFTAMRARGAQVTDIAVIIVAADDDVMPQTKEAINHASAAGVPIIFAINKIDKPGANPDKIKEELANLNYLVEEWGGKYQSQDISAKAGTNVDLLLEKILLEADLLELKANPKKPASGTVIESSLDKGRGYVATLLVRNGSMKIGDMLLAGYNYGHVKAMFNERNQKVEVAGPSDPVLVLGLNGAPQAGEKFNVMEDEREAKELAIKREQLHREQGMRAKKHITLDEIGRRIAIGNFQELNIVVKGDVDGSVEALSDALIKLSTDEIQVNVIHKAVGQITETDIMLAAASNAIVIGFQVRPSMAARKLAEKEEIDIRLYSIIYDAIEEVKDAMEGMLSPEIKEKIIATLEVRETFKISKVGTVAGCMVKEGKIKRSSKIRLIRDGIVIYTGLLGSLKRFKEDVKEVAAGYECGLNIANFNDIKVGDIIEAYEEVEVSRTL